MIQTRRLGGLEGWAGWSKRFVLALTCRGHAGNVLDAGGTEKGPEARLNIGPLVPLGVDKI